MFSGSMKNLNCCKKLNYSVSAVGKFVDLQIGGDAAKVVAAQCDY